MANTQEHCTVEEKSKEMWLIVKHGSVWLQSQQTKSLGIGDSLVSWYPGLYSKFYL